MTKSKIIEYANGDKIWYTNGKLHRTDGPAIEWVNVYDNGTRSWWLNGKRHRIDGPAIEYASGKKQWFLDGKEVTEEEFFIQTFKLPEELFVL